MNALLIMAVVPATRVVQMWLDHSIAVANLVINWLGTVALVRIWNKSINLNGTPCTTMLGRKKFF